MSQGVEEERPDEDGPSSQGCKVEAKSPRKHLLERAIGQRRPQEHIGLAGAGDEVHNELVLKSHVDARFSREAVDSQ